MPPRRQARPATQLYLVTPPVKDAQLFAADLRAALDAADFAAVLLKFPIEQEAAVRPAVAMLAPLVQGRGVALLLDGRADLASSLPADGAHLTGVDALRRAIPSLKPERIAGAGGMKTRHDAMLAGESGADYVMFGEPDPAGRRPEFGALVERIAWWAELFELPCVGYAADCEEAAALAAAGADFVAVGDLVWTGDIGAAAKRAAASIAAARVE